MKDITYCANTDCPFKDCKRNASQLKCQSGYASFADFGGVCRKYISWLVEKVDEESKNACKRRLEVV